MKKVLVKKNERLDDLLIDNLKLIQNPDYFCFSLDAVLLANFIRPKKNSKILDLGTGNGILPHLVQAKFQTKKIYGIDIQPEVIEMAQRSAKYNGLEEKIEFINLDLKEALGEFGTEAFDYLISNPPYMKAESGSVNSKDRVAIARHEIHCNLEDIIRVSNQLVKYKGKVAYVYRTQRLAELLSLLEKYNFACKRMRLIYPKLEEQANLVLIEAVKGGGVGLEVLPPLFVYNSDGSYTAEIEEIYYPEGKEE